MRAKDNLQQTLPLRREELAEAQQDGETHFGPEDIPAVYDRAWVLRQLQPHERADLEKLAETTQETILRLRYRTWKEGVSLAPVLDKKDHPDSHGVGNFEPASIEVKFPDGPIREDDQSQPWGKKRFK